MTEDPDQDPFQQQLALLTPIKYFKNERIEKYYLSSKPLEEILNELYERKLKSLDKKLSLDINEEDRMVYALFARIEGSDGMITTELAEEARNVEILNLLRVVPLRYYQLLVQLWLKTQLPLTEGEVGSLILVTNMFGLQKEEELLRLRRTLLRVA